MSLETRPGSAGIYYTRSRRVNGRVKREYVGSGDVARFAMLLDLEARIERQEALEAQERELQQLAAHDLPLDELCAVTDALARCLLVSCGYHRHKGEWRLRRGIQAV